MGNLRRALVWMILLLGLTIGPALARPEGPIEIHRASAPIAVDGDLSDPGWKDAVRVADWVETNPGDNVAPKVASVGCLAYDERFLYVGFEFEDPDPRAIRAPLGDRDNVPSYTDYGGVIVDGTDDGRTAQMFLANPRGIQYDALTSDASGEDSAPDWFWDSAARVAATGWTLEMRIPFSSLRYVGSDPASGGSCSTATIRATSATRCSARVLPRDSATASSATRGPRRPRPGCRRAATGWWRPTPPGAGRDGGRRPRTPLADGEAELGRRRRREVGARAPTPWSTRR